MEDIQNLIIIIKKRHGFTTADIASRVHVSGPTVERWAKGSSRPSPKNEGNLRSLLADLEPIGKRIAETSSIYTPSLFLDEEQTRKRVSDALYQMREALHRRARLSSRNEALDELSKILFAHIKSPNGIALDHLGIGDSSRGAARILSTFVAKQFQDHFPDTLGHGLTPEDFVLRIKPEEDELARELVHSIEMLGGTDNPDNRSGLKRLDILNQVFGSFLANSFSQEKELGQYLTPTEVVRFMIELVLHDLDEDEIVTLADPEKCASFGWILDPSCGVGSFLSEFSQIVGKKVLEYHGEEGLEKWIDIIGRVALVGFDKSERMIRLALANMSISGLRTTHLYVANSLARKGAESGVPNSFVGEVRLIFTNPPFGAEFKGRDIEEYVFAQDRTMLSYASVNSEVLFLERYIEWLVPGGRFLAIVPDSILTNKGMFSDVRHKMGKLMDIRAIISLPRGTFAAAGTDTKTSILYGIKKPIKQREKSSSFVAICNDVGYRVKTRGSQRTKETNGKGELPDILDAFRNPGRKMEYIRRINQLDSKARWDAKYHASLPLYIEKRLQEASINNLFVSDVATLASDRTDPRRWGKGTFQYIEISGIDGETFGIRANRISYDDAPSRARKLVKEGDVLISTVRPERRTIGVVPRGLDGAVCSTGLAVLRPSGMDPMVLAKLMSSDFVTSQVMRNTLGINYPAVDEEVLLSILLPIDPDTVDGIKPLADGVRQATDSLNEAKQVFDQRLVEASQRWEEKTT